MPLWLRAHRFGVRRDRIAVLAAAGVLFATACGEVGSITDCSPGETLTPVCDFQNPEDLAALPGGWIVVSQFPEDLETFTGAGGLVAFRPSDGARRPLFPAEGAPEAQPVEGVGAPDCPGPPRTDAFAPHGIDVRERENGPPHLLAVNHTREAIEIFGVGMAASGPTLVWQGCIPLPEDALANDVVALPGGGLAATKFVPRDPGFFDIVRVLFSRPTGHVLVWRAGDGWSVLPGSEASMPNGIEVSSDGERFFVAGWRRQRLLRLSRDGEQRDEVALSFHPDNLTWASDGRLLVAGQKGSLFDARACGEVATGTCALPFVVAAVHPETLAVEEILVHDPATKGGAASVALEHARSLWIGTFRGDRLLRMRLVPGAASRAPRTALRSEGD